MVGTKRARPDGRGGPLGLEIRELKNETSRRRQGESVVFFSFRDVLLFDAVPTVVRRLHLEAKFLANPPLSPDARSKLVDYGKAEAFRGEPLVPFKRAQ